MGNFSLIHRCKNWIGAIMAHKRHTYKHAVDDIFSFPISSSHHALHVTQKCRKNVFNFLFLTPPSILSLLRERWDGSWRKKLCEKRVRRSKKPLSITQFVEGNFNTDIPFENEEFNLLAMGGKFSKLNMNLMCADVEGNWVHLTFKED